MPETGTSSEVLVPRRVPVQQVLVSRRVYSIGFTSSRKTIYNFEEINLLTYCYSCCNLILIILSSLTLGSPLPSLFEVEI